MQEEDKQEGRCRRVFWDEWSKEWSTCQSICCKGKRLDWFIYFFRFVLAKSSCKNKSISIWSSEFRIIDGYNPLTPFKSDLWSVSFSTRVGLFQGLPKPALWLLGLLAPIDFKGENWPESHTWEEETCLPEQPSIILILSHPGHCFSSAAETRQTFLVLWEAFSLKCLMTLLRPTTFIQNALHLCSAAASKILGCPDRPHTSYRCLHPHPQSLYI